MTVSTYQIRCASQMGSINKTWPQTRALDDEIISTTTMLELDVNPDWFPLKNQGVELSGL